MGVVRIYAQKVKFLLTDCSDASGKIKLAFRPGVVDLPAATAASLATQVTLPGTAGWPGLAGDVFGETDFGSIMTVPTGADKELVFAAGVSNKASHTSRPQDITLEEAPVMGFRFDMDENDTFGRGDSGAFLQHLSSGLSSGLDIEVGRDAHSGTDDFLPGPELTSSSNRGSGIGIRGNADKNKGGQQQEAAAKDRQSIASAAGIDLTHETMPDFGGADATFGDDSAMLPVDYSIGLGGDDNMNLNDNNNDNNNVNVANVAAAAGAPAQNQQEVVAARAPAKKRKRVVVKEDTNTEISDAQMKKLLADSSETTRSFEPSAKAARVSRASALLRGAEVEGPAPLTAVPERLLGIWNLNVVFNAPPALPALNKNMVVSVVEPAEDAAAAAEMEVDDLGARENAAANRSLEVEVGRDAAVAPQDFNPDVSGIGAGMDQGYDAYDDMAMGGGNDVSGLGASALNNTSARGDDLVAGSDDEAGGDLPAPSGPADPSAFTENTRKTMKLFQDEFAQADHISIHGLIKGSSRKARSRVFFETLVLASKNFVHINQDSPYADIVVKPTPHILAASV